MRLDDVASTRDEVARLIARIRAKHGDDCIDYSESSAQPRACISPLGLSQRVALWMVADVLLQTPIREGLSLNSLEYIFVSMQESRRLMAESASFVGRSSPTTPGYSRAVSRLAMPPAAGAGGAAASGLSDWNSESAAATPHIIPDARVAGGTGVVILSEFSMASQCLNGVFRVNPYVVCGGELMLCTVITCLPFMRILLTI